MRDDLIKQISELKDINHVVVLTHNIDFVFLQTVFLSALRQCGHPSLTLFADAQCARESYHFQSSMITGLGRRFRVVPVVMQPGYRFHPKAVFLSGAQQGVLFVGSGNMTFGGMRENVEIWKRFDTDKDEFAAISAFRDYLNSMLSRVVLKEAVEMDFAEIFDERNHHWIDGLGEAGELLGRVGNSEQLLSIMLEVIGNEPVARITVSTPYFDPEGEALRQLSEIFSRPPTDVLIQSKRSTLFREAVQTLPANIQLKTVVFSSNVDGSEKGNRFIHAKYFAFQQGQQVTVFAGSANCSRAALLKSGEAGNAELMVYQTMTKDSFNTDFMHEFTVTNSEPELLNQDEDESINEIQPHIQLLGARVEINILRVGYAMASDINIKTCVVDDAEKEFELVKSGELLVRVDCVPTSVVITGVCDGEEVHSNKIWVDDESALRSTSRGRAFLDRIRRSESTGDMGADEWGLIVELFARDLNYTTAKELRDRNSTQSDDIEQDTSVSRADIFSDSYDKAPNIPNHLFSMGDKQVNIYNLLLHAFGIGSSPSPSATNEDGQDDSFDSNDDDNTVDKPVRVDRVPVKKLKEKDVTERQRKKIAKVVVAITESFIDPIYLEHRDPERLGIDLQIAGLLLRKAYSKTWINKDQFFDATQSIWSTLFFSSSQNKTRGWLDIRYQLAQDKVKFVSSLSSCRLAATLYAWATAIDVKEGGSYVQRFLVSFILSMGRFPWLWFDSLNEEETYGHILNILRDSPCMDEDMFDLESVHNQRVTLLRKGVAVVQMETALAGEEPSILLSRMNFQDVTKGEVLWQGAKRGFCISLEESQGREFVKVLCLQDPEGSTAFKKDHLMPVRELLLPTVIQNIEGFGPIQRKEVNNVLQQLAVCGM